MICVKESLLNEPVPIYRLGIQMSKILRFQVGRWRRKKGVKKFLFPRYLNKMINWFNFLHLMYIPDDSRLYLIVPDRT